MTIGYSSNRAVDLHPEGKLSIFLSQASENHSPFKESWKPTEGVSSEKNSIEADVSDCAGKNKKKKEKCHSTHLEEETKIENRTGTHDLKLQSHEASLLF